MRSIIIQLLVSFLISGHILAQNLSDSLAHSFIKALLNDSPYLEEFVHQSELKLSKRLGISYPDAKNKFLISNDVDSKIMEEVKNGKLNYEIDIDTINQDYSILKFEIPARQIKNEYYFYRSKLISKPYYFARKWEIEKSKYFLFHISDPSLINEYSKNRLDSFVDDLLTQFNFTEIEKTKLQKEKIHYFLCRDENEIKLLTGYKARGLYFIPYDYIISTFNCHYHELVHLLINYKLKTTNLYTMPLLQEGLAVAFGGRGGKEPNVILNMGLFLAQSNFVDYKAMLNKNEFYQFDPSMTYPVAGLYTKFLIDEIGIKKYLELYRKYSSNLKNINSLKINEVDLPVESKWKEFLFSYKIENSIRVFGFAESEFNKLIVDELEIKIFEGDRKYLFKVKGIFGVKTKIKFENYESKLFDDLFPNKLYNEEKYIITVNNEEVSVYNLFTNNLIAKYVKGFSLKQFPVSNQNGYFTFTISKNVFDEDQSKLNFSKVNLK